MALCTLTDAENVLRATQAGTGAITATEQAKLLRAVQRVTRRIEQLGFEFEPTYDTEYITADGMNVESGKNVLTLSRPLLEIVTLTNDGTALVENTDYYAYPRGKYPVRRLRMDEDSTYSWYPNCGSSGDTFDTVLITGFWGQKKYYSREGFINSGDTVEESLTATDTTITVNDADGLDAFNRTPRFSAGNLIRIENELCEVLATNTTTNVLTVRRGVRGTTAAVHAQGTVRKVWNVNEDIRDTVARQAAAFYARIGAFETAVVTDLTQVNYPKDLLAELYGVLQGYV
jgi:hypothetical protein